MRLPYDRLGDVTLKGKIVIFMKWLLKVQKFEMLVENLETVTPMGFVESLRRFVEQLGE